VSDRRAREVLGPQVPVRLISTIWDATPLPEKP
jgi:hypothetical protein